MDKIKNWVVDYWQASLDKRSTKGLIVMIFFIATFVGVVGYGLFAK